MENNKLFIFYSTPNCHFCEIQKELLHKIPEIEEKIDFLNALEHKEECLSPGIRSVPALVVIETKKVYTSIGNFTKEDWEKLLEEATNN